MKKEYGIIGLILLIVIALIWFFFFKNFKRNDIRLENTDSLSVNNNNEYLENNTLVPDNIKDYNEILVNKKNLISLTFPESILSSENNYTVSSSKENGILVSTGSIKVKRPYDIVRLWKSEVKTGGAILMGVSRSNTVELKLDAKSTAIALVSLALNDVQRSDENIILKIENNQNLHNLISIISNNFEKNKKISPTDFNTYPELSPLIDIIKNDVIK